VLDAARSGAIDATVLRIAVANGPGAPASSLFGVVARHLALAAAALDRGDSPDQLVLAPLRAYRDLVDVRDVADAVLAAARAEVTGEVINIGGAAALPVGEVVDTMIRLAGVPVEVAFAEDSGAPVRSEVPWLLLDISKAHRLLGWGPRRSLEASLRDLLAEARDQEARDRAAAAVQAPARSVSPPG
jgi:nucleoside-diphosphate-sugar epimerase